MPRTKPSFASFSDTTLDPRSTIPFPAIGSLHLDKTGKDSFKLGQDLERKLMQVDPVIYSGPFACPRDKYLAVINTYITLLESDDITDIDTDLCTYLTHLEMRELVGKDAEMGTPSACYIKHEDLNFSNVMQDEAGRLTGIIDWEWCVDMVRVSFFHFGKYGGYH
jgi:hypothetical protein